MTARSVLPIVVVLLVAAAGPAQNTKQELDKLQGEWTMVSLEQNGKKASDESVKKLKLTIMGEKWMVQFGDAQPGKTTFKIDSSKNPKTIDLTFNFGDKKVVSPGIYKVGGDTLTLCRTSGKAERPKEFKIRDEADILVVWKRAKK
jgi:uncharacterized protein (TIGR03067 family)